MTKVVIRATMRTKKKTEIQKTTERAESTLTALVDPCGGSHRFRLALLSGADPHGYDDERHDEQRQGAAELHDRHGLHRVGAGIGVEVEAPEDEAVHGGSQFAFRGLDEAQFHASLREPVGRVPRRLQAAGEDAVRREDEDRGAVGVLVPLLVPLVAEADRVAERHDVLLATGHEVPAAGGARAAVLAHVVLLLLLRERRGLQRVEGDRDDLEVVAHGKVDLAEGLRHLVEDEVAEQGAAVVAERQDDGLLAVEIVAELLLLPVLVHERQVERQLRAGDGVDLEILDILRERVLPILGERERRREKEDRDDGSRQLEHDVSRTADDQSPCFRASSVTTSSIARSIGMRTVPSFSLIQR
jgi:hypothetical protein